jgi:glycosyltransferase involved in cell wall biosynthesis
MKVLFVLTYYRPHVSGLTIYVQRLAESLAGRGHEVTVLTSHYDPGLLREEQMDGVRVVRVPVLLRLSKGVIMPTFAGLAARLIAEHDVVSVHLPQFEAGLLAFLCRYVVRRPVALTYHCDLQLPPGAFNRFVDQVVFLMNSLAGMWADAVVAYTDDYAIHSPFLSQFPGKRWVIPPPVDMPEPPEPRVIAFRQRYELNGKPVLGFAARLAAEKGVEYVLEALPLMLEQLPNLQVLFAGPYRDVLGEEAYYRRLQPLLERYADHWTFLGTLDPAEMADFYAACDCTILPSINSTESFGLVQVESMLCGTPVVASDLPGVRVPVRTTGMGRIVPTRDAQEIASAVVEVIQNRGSYLRPRAEVARYFSTEHTAEEYERLFRTLIGAVAREGPWWGPVKALTGFAALIGLAWAIQSSWRQDEGHDD